MSRTSPYDKIRNEKSLSCIVKPNAKKTMVKGYDEERKAYLLDVNAPPENNKANQELIKYLSKITGKKPRIKSGLTSKKKLIVF
jgi:uncharacterized protein